MKKVYAGNWSQDFSLRKQARYPYANNATKGVATHRAVGRIVEESTPEVRVHDRKLTNSGCSEVRMTGVAWSKLLSVGSQQITRK